MTERTATTRYGDVETIPGVSPAFRARFDGDRLTALTADQLAFLADVVLAGRPQPGSDGRRAALLDAPPERRADALEQLTDHAAMWERGRSGFAFERGHLNRLVRTVLEHAGRPADPDAVLAVLPGVTGWSSYHRSPAWSPPGRDGRMLLHPPDEHDTWVVVYDLAYGDPPDPVEIPQASFERVVTDLLAASEQLPPARR